MMTIRLGNVKREDYNLPAESKAGRWARSLATRVGLKGSLQPIWRVTTLAGTVRRMGWFKSARIGKAVNGVGLPIPWWSYPFISFLDERLTDNLRVFEFGSGHSSLWLMERVAEVTTSEVEDSWADYISSIASPKVRLKRVSELHEAIVDEGKFDLVVVDGGDRVRCARAALEHLADGGVIIWDDSDWRLFREAWPEFEAHGFRELPFEGLQPIMGISCRTSVLYRQVNCLGI